MDSSKNQGIMERTVKARTLGGYVRSLSGLFITKENKLGLTETECSILAALIHILKERNEKVVSKEVKEDLANMSNHGVQVITNYVNKLKRKGAITGTGMIHPILTSDKIVIEYDYGQNHV